jgi:histidinol dehydrogenase
MTLYHASQLTREDRKHLCLRPWSMDTSLRETVASVCLDVQQRGDDALREYSKRFDAIPVSELRVSPAELELARNNAPRALIAAIEYAARNIRAFHAAQMRTESKIETEAGVICWREQRPIESVGLYIPAGSAPLPSTVLMLGIPALLAGSSRIVLCSPPKSNGNVDPSVLATAAYLGIREIYKIGGEQAIAAMAYGTQSIPKVEKIFGPGNQYVTEAKRLVSSNPGGAAIDLLAGPSELLIIADDSAQPAIVAADLLSQAEHDPQSQVVLLTTSESLARTALDEVRRQLELLSRNEIAAKSLDKSYAIVVQSVEEAVGFSNMYAPEHLLINTREPEAFVPQIRNAGSVFLGSFAPVTAGDYASGTNHTLPTGGSARWVSGVSVDSFQKSLTFQSITREGLQRLAPALTTLAQTEGLEAHARAVAQRLEERTRS